MSRGEVHDMRVFSKFINLLYNEKYNKSYNKTKNKKLNVKLIKNKGFSLVELVVVMAIMGFLGLAVAGFIGTSTKQYKYASKEVDLQYEAQITMNQIGDLLIDAQKGVKYEDGSAVSPVEVASLSNESGVAVQTLTGDAAIDNAAISAQKANANSNSGIATQSDDSSSKGVAAQAASSDKKLIIYDSDCIYNIIFRPSDSKLYLRKDTVDETTGNVTEGAESLMADHVVGFTPDLSEAEKKNSIQLVVDFKDGDKTYTSTQNFTMRNKVPVGKDVEYEEEPAEPESIHIYYGGNDVSGGSISYIKRTGSNILDFTSKILGGNNPSQDVLWSYTGTANEWTGTTFNTSANSASLSLGYSETSKKFIVTVASKDNLSLSTSVTINIVDTSKWLTTEGIHGLNGGNTEKTHIDPSAVRESGIEYDANNFEWHIEAYEVYGTLKIRNDDVLKNNSEEKADYEGGKMFTWHIEPSKVWWPKFEDTSEMSITSGNQIGSRHYEILVWVTLKSDPSIGSNVITFTYNR